MTFLNPVDRLEDYLQNVAPSPIELDENSDVLRSSLQDLAELNLLALRVPGSWYGLGANETTFYTFQEWIARYSGALAFLQTQHQSAASLLVKSQNESLKQAYLPLMGNGQKLVGIGFSHLRREDNPPIKAIAVSGGYRLHGQVPWVTGFGFFQTFIVAAVLPDGQAVYGMVPFTKTQQAGGEILFSEPMPLAAMNSTQTVAAHLTDWLLPDSEVAFVHPVGAIHQSDRLNVLNHSFFALGCAQAGLDLLEKTSKTKPFLAIASAFNSLTHELNDCRQQIHTAQQHGESFEEKLRLRVWAIDLANRCAQAAVTVSSGAANSQYHPAQRIYREALVFTVSGQTTAVMEKTLDRLVTRNPILKTL